MLVKTYKFDLSYIDYLIPFEKELYVDFLINELKTND